MSDSLALINTVLSRGEIEIPRYADMFIPQEDEETTVKKSEQIVSKFDKLRRRE